MVQRSQRTHTKPIGQPAFKGPRIYRETPLRLVSYQNDVRDQDIDLYFTSDNPIGGLISTPYTTDNAFIRDRYADCFYSRNSPKLPDKQISNATCRNCDCYTNPPGCKHGVEAETLTRNGEIIERRRAQHIYSRSLPSLETRGTFSEASWRATDVKRTVFAFPPQSGQLADSPPAIQCMLQQGDRATNQIEVGK